MKVNVNQKLVNAFILSETCARLHSYTTDRIESITDLRHINKLLGNNRSKTNEYKAI
jgi:hypothetical protein